MNILPFKQRYVPPQLTKVDVGRFSYNNALLQKLVSEKDKNGDPVWRLKGYGNRVWLVKP